MFEYGTNNSSRCLYLQDHCRNSRLGHRKGCRMCLGWMCRSSLRKCSRRPSCFGTSAIVFDGHSITRCPYIVATPSRSSDKVSRAATKYRNRRREKRCAVQNQAQVLSYIADSLWLGLARFLQNPAHIPMRLASGRKQYMDRFQGVPSEAPQRWRLWSVRCIGLSGLDWFASGRCVQ